MAKLRRSGTILNIQVGVAVAILAVVVLVLVWSLQPKRAVLPGPCLPASVNSALKNSAMAKRTPGDVHLYFDVSAGMAGYTVPSPNGKGNAMGNIVAVSRNFVHSSLYKNGEPGKARFSSFGVYRFDGSKPAAPPIVDDPARLGSPEIYRETDTHIADLLRWIDHEHGQAGKAGAPLSVVVTDLMLDDRRAIEDFEASVGGILRSMMIEDRLAVGVLAVRVPFRGPIYLNPKVARADLSDRPLILLLIGDPYQVRSYYDYLSTSEIGPFSTQPPIAEKRFAVFGLEAANVATADPQITGAGSGFAQSPLSTEIPGAQRLRSFTYSPDEVRKDGKGRLAVTLAADTDVREFEVVGNEPLDQILVWKLDENGISGTECKASDVWARSQPVPPTAKKRQDQKITYTFGAEEMRQAEMDKKGVYLVQILAGQRGLVEDHPAAAWMTEWSESTDQMRARLENRTGGRNLGVPSLASLRKILMVELMLPGRQEIQRSSSQFLIQTK